MSHDTIGSNMYPLVVTVQFTMSLVVAHGQPLPRAMAENVVFNTEAFRLDCYGAPKDWLKH